MIWTYCAQRRSQVDFIKGRLVCQGRQILAPGETHLDFLPDKKANQAKFVIIFLGVVGWVERNSLMIANLRGPFECPLCLNLPKFE